LDDIQEKYVDNEAVASPPYPFLDEKDVDYPDNTAGTLEEDDDVSSIPPPAYSLNDDVVVVNENDDEVAIPPPYSLTHSSPVLQPETISKLPRIKTVQFSQRTKKVPNRMELLFYSFVQRKNNDAAWLGSNSKLTRLKLQGDSLTHSLTYLLTHSLTHSLTRWLGECLEVEVNLESI
jgi:hypothetical protein